MNKKLLAIAVGAAMVAGATAATAGDEPTWYGKIHMSIDSMDNGGDLTANEGDGIFVFVEDNDVVGHADLLSK